MKSRRHGLNSTVCAALLLWGSVIPHVMMGGDLIRIDHFLLQALLIFTMWAGLRVNNLHGPRLAFVVLLAQSSSHFVLGGMNNSSTGMAIAHIAAGFITYSLITHYQRSWLELAKEFLPAFYYLLTHTFIQRKVTFHFGIFSIIGWNDLSRLKSHRDRGPPASLKSNFLLANPTFSY